MAIILKCFYFIITMHQIKHVIAGSKCQDEILYSVFATFGTCIIFIAIAAIIYTCKTKKKNKKVETSTNRSDIEGRRNKVYEQDDSLVERKQQNSKCHKRQDSGFIASSNESIIPFPETFRDNSPKKSPSMPNLPTRRISCDVHGVSDKSYTIDDNPPQEAIVETRSIGTSTAEEENIETDVSIEKKSFNCAGLDFSIAGIYIKDIDLKDISFQDGEIQKGDEVTAINGFPMIGLNDMEAFSHFARSGSNVQLRIIKRKYLSKVKNEIRKALKCTSQSNAPINTNGSLSTSLNSNDVDNKTTKEVAVVRTNEVDALGPKQAPTNALAFDANTAIEETILSINTVAKPNENIITEYDHNQNIKIVEKLDNVINKTHEKSKSAESHQTSSDDKIITPQYLCDKHLTKLNKSLDHNVLPVNSECDKHLTRLNKSLDHNVLPVNSEKKYIKRARSEENLRQHKNNSFSRSVSTADGCTLLAASSDLLQNISYQEYLRQRAAMITLDKLSNNNNEANIPTSPSSLLGENVIVQRGYNKDYISPINGQYTSIQLPRLQHPSSRVHTTISPFIPQTFITNTPSPINSCSNECNQSNIGYNGDNPSNIGYNGVNPSSPVRNIATPQTYPISYNIYMQNKNDYSTAQGLESQLISNNNSEIELDADVMRYMTKKYSEPRLQRKDPPPYSGSHNTIKRGSTNASECTVIKRHQKRNGRSRSRPHSYTESSDANHTEAEVISNIGDGAVYSSEQERRNHPKRAHSMPAVKHLEKRPKIAKTFLEKEPKQRTHKRFRQRNRNQQEEIDRRKSIDSGTLQKLAAEMQNNPLLEGEYPIISKLLGESQFAASERRAQTLYRYKSTEAICSQF